jgi:glycosyltransferase involved in cell wall biosynthesis
MYNATSPVEETACTRLSCLFTNEAASLPRLFDSLDRALTGTDCETIFVDDGSTDGSRDLLRQRSQRNPRSRLVALSRNFGQTAALAAGLDAATGDVIVTLDADGQNDPADIPALLRSLGEGVDVVCGWRKNRRDAWLTRLLPSRLANRLITAVTGVRLHDHGCTLKAFRPLGHRRAAPLRRNAPLDPGVVRLARGRYPRSRSGPPPPP